MNRLFFKSLNLKARRMLDFPLKKTNVHPKTQINVHCVFPTLASLETLFFFSSPRQHQPRSQVLPGHGPDGGGSLRVGHHQPESLPRADPRPAQRSVSQPGSGGRHRRAVSPLRPEPLRRGQEGHGGCAQQPARYGKYRIITRFA